MLLNEIKKAALIGVGGTALAAEKTVEGVNHLVNRGKLSVEEGKQLTSQLIKRKNGDEITARDREQLEALLVEMNVAQRKDIDDLEQKVRELEAKIEEKEIKK